MKGRNVPPPTEPPPGEKATNIVEANFQGEQDKLLAAVEAMQRNAEVLVQYNHVLAGIRRKSYQSHIDAGFTPPEALELCKQIV